MLWNAAAMAVGMEPAELEAACDVKMVGTPLTHARFLRRKYGTYGPALRADEGKVAPLVQTGVRGLLCTGDSTFPGIGLPAVAASGMLAANTVASVWDHMDMLTKIFDKEEMRAF